MKKFGMMLSAGTIFFFLFFSCGNETKSSPDSDSPVADEIAMPEEESDVADSFLSLDNGPTDTADAEQETSTDDSPTAIYELLSASEAAALIEERKNDPTFHIFDVRTPSEFSGGHIAGAENHNVSDSGFDDAMASLPKSDAYLVYCASGSRSKGAINTMKSIGFITLYELDGGISKWKSAGYPVTTD